MAALRHGLATRSDAKARQSSDRPREGIVNPSIGKARQRHECEGGERKSNEPPGTATQWQGEAWTGADSRRNGDAPIRLARTCGAMERLGYESTCDAKAWTRKEMRCDSLQRHGKAKQSYGTETKEKSMDIKVFTMVEVVHLSGTASPVDSDDLSAWGKTYSSMPEAMLSVKNAIQSAVYAFYEGSDMTCDDLDKMVDVVFGDRREDGDWVWDPADRSYLWRIVEDVLYVPCDCGDESDTTMEQLGYRKDDSEHVDVSDDRKYPKLSVWFENSSTPGSELGMEFSTPEDALAWAAAYDGGNSEFSSTWLPCIIRVVTPGYTRDIHDCAGNWEDFIGELAYACGDDGSFSDPDELERRNEKYREWYREV